MSEGEQNLYKRLNLVKYTQRDTDHDKGGQGIKGPLSFILLVIHEDGFLR